MAKEKTKIQTMLTLVLRNGKDARLQYCHPSCGSY